MAVVKELDRVLSGKVISRTGGSFHRNMDEKYKIEKYRFTAGVFSVYSDQDEQWKLVDKLVNICSSSLCNCPDS